MPDYDHLNGGWWFSLEKLNRGYRVEDTKLGTSQLAEMFGREPDPSLALAARAFLDRRANKEHHEAALKLANEQLAAAEGVLLSKLDEAGVLSVKLDDAGQKTLLASSTTAYYSLPAGALDEPEIVRWLYNNGARDLLRNTLHHASFSAFCRELVEKGRNLHPLVKVANRRWIALRKETP